MGSTASSPLETIIAESDDELPEGLSSVQRRPDLRPCEDAHTSTLASPRSFGPDIDPIAFAFTCAARDAGQPDDHSMSWSKAPPTEEPAEGETCEVEDEADFDLDQGTTLRSSSSSSNDSDSVDSEEKEEAGNFHRQRGWHHPDRIRHRHDYLQAPPAAFRGELRPASGRGRKNIGADVMVTVAECRMTNSTTW